MKNVLLLKYSEVGSLKGTWSLERRLIAFIDAGGADERAGLVVARLCVHKIRLRGLTKLGTRLADFRIAQD